MNRRHKYLIVFIVLLLTGVAIAATLENSTEQCGVLNHGLFMMPVYPDTTAGLTDDDMAAMLGLQDSDMLAPGSGAETGNRLDSRARYNPDKGYRWRYKY